METQRTKLWCTVLGKSVAVMLVENPRASPAPGIPEGWEAQQCLDKNTICYGKPCPFTVEEDVRGDVGWPFGSEGERG